MIDEKALEVGELAERLRGDWPDREARLQAADMLVQQQHWLEDYTKGHAEALNTIREQQQEIEKLKKTIGKWAERDALVEADSVDRVVGDDD